MEPEQIQKISKALADPRRREILAMIASTSCENGMHCTALVDRLPISQPTVSHHVKELTNAGLIEVRSAGQYNYLFFKADVMEAYLTALVAAFHLSAQSPKI